MAVLISIKPKYCELIASGKKTIEWRKTHPKCDAPFKCYIYETKEIYMPQLIDSRFKCQGSGMVIGEFICYKFTDKYLPLIEGGCLSVEELHEYANGGNIYGWHISDLKIYDKPKELSEFYSECKNIPKQCRGCRYRYYESDTNFADCMSNIERFKPVTRAPQSWMYVEELI